MSKPVLYQYSPSGNCYKVRWLFNELGVSYERVEVDLARGSAADASVLALLPFGRVPALKLGDGHWLAESNAILLHYAEGSSLLPPVGSLERARVSEWLFWEQYDHEPYIAVLRAWRKFFGVPAGREGEVDWRFERGEQALGRMESVLAGREFLAGAFSVADIALYAYTHVAADGGFDLGKYPAILAWFARCEARAKYLKLGA